MYRPPTEGKKGFHTRCHSQRSPIDLMKSTSWKDRFAEAFAREIMAKTLGRSGFGTDIDELAKRIRKMLDQYEEEWG